MFITECWQCGQVTNFDTPAGLWKYVFIVFNFSYIITRMNILPMRIVLIFHPTYDGLYLNTRLNVHNVHRGIVTQNVCEKSNRSTIEFSGKNLVCKKKKSDNIYFRIDKCYKNLMFKKKYIYTKTYKFFDFFDFIIIIRARIL